MKKEHKIIVVVSIFYAVYILLFLAKFDFNPSATVEFSQKHANTKILPPGLVVQVNRDGHDGQQYYERVLDIFYHKMSDTCTYQRILYPMLAYLFTFGNISLIPWTLLLLNFVSVVLGTYVFIQILNHYKSNLNITYLFAFNIGFLVTVIRDMPEPLLALFLLLFVLFFERKQYKLSSLSLAFALLTKEITLLVICPLLLYFLMKREFGKTIIYFFPLAVFFIWQFILFLQFGAPPFLRSIFWMGSPISGAVDYIKFFRNFVVTSASPVSLEVFKWILWYYLGFWLLFFAVIQIYVMFKSKSRGVISIYTVLLSFWTASVFFIFSMGNKDNLTRLDELGRYLIPLFIFSILYSVERKQKYNFLLGLILSLASVIWFIERIIIFKVQYFVT